MTGRAPMRDPLVLALTTAVPLEIQRMRLTSSPAFRRGEEVNDHADELDDAQGRVDANLSELAHVCRELTGFDARTVTTEETSS